MKICIAGKNQIAVDALDIVNELGLKNDDILVCFNDTDYGEDNWQPSLKKKAIENHYDTVVIQDLYNIKNLLEIGIGSLENEQMGGLNGPIAKKFNYKTGNSLKCWQ